MTQVFIEDMPIETAVDEESMAVSIGGDSVDLVVDGQWVRAGREEINSFVDNQMKPELTEYTYGLETELSNLADEKTVAFNQNVLEQTAAFDTNADNQTVVFNHNAAAKQAAVDASAAAAATSAAQAAIVVADMADRDLSNLTEAGQAKFDAKQNVLTFDDTPTEGSANPVTSGGVYDQLYHPDLFDIKWSDHQLNDMSWLQADTFSWHSGEVYAVAYDKLVTEYNGTGTTETENGITFKRTTSGFKIATADQENTILTGYNMTGIAWYYILDTTNKRFKLPRTKFGFTGIRTEVANAVQAGVPNITGVIYQPNPSAGGFANMVSSGALYTYQFANIVGKYAATGGDTAAGIGFDASCSNSVYGASDTVQPPATEMYLYFFVGNYTQPVVEQTAGLNAELFNEKLDLDCANANQNGTTFMAHQAMPSDRAIELTWNPNSTGTSWSYGYVAPSDGYFFAEAGCNGGYIHIEFVTYAGNLRHKVSSGEPLAGTTCAVFLPVKAGTSIDIALATNASVVSGSAKLIFIYAEGAQ